MTGGVFEIFEQQRRESAGTGMGLAICRRIVARHGGGIRVESAPEEDATFTVSIPTDDPERPDVAEADIEVAPLRPASPSLGPADTVVGAGPGPLTAAGDRLGPRPDPRRVTAQSAQETVVRPRIDFRKAALIYPSAAVRFVR
jgi:hypothetical protein